MNKPRVREMRQVSDARHWIVSYLGLHRIATVSGCQQSVNPSGTLKEAEYQVNRLINQIERELA